jgi:hypothetical protein
MTGVVPRRMAVRRVDALLGSGSVWLQQANGTRRKLGEVSSGLVMKFSWFSIDGHGGGPTL